MIFATIKLLSLLLNKALCDQMNIQLPGRLAGSVYRTMYSMGEIQCGKECVVRTKCMSVNYQRHSLTCEFNTINNGNSLTQDFTWIFLDKHDLLQLYENNVCSGDCPPNSMCVTLSNQQSTCVITECIPPPNVHHATISRREVGVSQETVYKCITNFHITRQSNWKLTCLADGTFTDIDFVCELKPCPSPPDVPFAEIDMYDSLVGGKAFYKCVFGYGTFDDKSLTCLHGEYFIVGC